MSDGKMTNSIVVTWLLRMMHIHRCNSILLEKMTVFSTFYTIFKEYM